MALTMLVPFFIYNTYLYINLHSFYTYLHDKMPMNIQMECHFDYMQPLLYIIMEYFHNT